jgi:integrase
VFSYAVDRHQRADNPVSKIRKFAENKRDRRLSDQEYAALGGGFRQMAATIWPAAVSCARFLAVTGWRSGEALGLRWADVNLATRTATLADTRSGGSLRPLSHIACDVLRGMPNGGGDALIFPATRGDGPMGGFKKFVRRIVASSGLPNDVTPHVLRHSFASLAADLGYSEATIGALIGHKGRTVTSRYLHSADAVLLAAANAVADEIARRMREHRAPAPQHGNDNQRESRRDPAEADVAVAFQVRADGTKDGRLADAPVGVTLGTFLRSHASKAPPKSVRKKPHPKPEVKHENSPKPI